MNIGRRTFIKAAAGVAAASVLGAPYIAHAAEPLVINSYGGEFEKFMRDSIIPDFEKQTGIKTRLDVGLANHWLATCRAAGPENPPYDVLMVNAIWASLLRTEGFFAPLSVSLLPNLADVYPVARYPNDEAVTGWFQPMGLAYTPGTIQTPPKAWKDLWTNRRSRAISAFTPSPIPSS